MNKRVAEWLGELKIIDSRIESNMKKFKDNEQFVLQSKLLYGVRAGEFDKQADEALSLYQSTMALIRNKSKIRQALMKHNATTELTIAGETITIAHANEIRKNPNIMFGMIPLLERQLAKIASVREALDDKREYAIDELRRQSGVSATSSKKDEAGYQMINDQYGEKFIDKIDIQQKYKELQEKKTQFLSEINVALNISNAEYTLDIDLETA